MTKSSIKTNSNNLETLDLNTYYNKCIDLELSKIYVYQDILIVIISKFKNKILNKYIKKKL